MPESTTPRAVLRSRWRPAAIHFATSTVVVVAGAAGLVLLWYPAPYGAIAGGFQLLVLLVVVDLVLGPVLTAVVARPGKALRVFAQDLAVILVAQLAALAFGVYTLADARPIGLVFELSRFRVVAATEVDRTQLDAAPPGLRRLSWTGPQLFAVVKPTDPAELFTVITLGLGGVDLGMLPKYWRPYDTQRDAVLRAGRPVATFLAERPDARSAIDRMAAAAGVSRDDLRVLPLVSRRSEGWATLVAAPDARVVGLLAPGAPN